MREAQVQSLVASHLIPELASLVASYAAGFQGLLVDEFENSNHVESVSAVGDDLMLVLRNGNRRFHTRDSSFLFSGCKITCFASISETVAVCGAKGFLKFCHPSEPMKHKVFYTPGTVTCLAVTQAGDVVAGTNFGLIAVWSMRKHDPLWVRKSIYATTEAIATRGKWVAATGFCYIRAYRLDSDKIVDFNHCNRQVTSVVFVSDTVVASGGHDCSVRLWDLVAGTNTRVFSGHHSWVTCLCLLPDGNIASGSSDGDVRIWGPVGCVDVLRACKKQIRSIAVARGGLVVCSNLDTLIYQ